MARVKHTALFHQIGSQTQKTQKTNKQLEGEHTVLPATHTRTMPAFTP